MSRFLLIWLGLAVQAGADPERAQEDFQLIVKESDWKYSPEKLHRIFKQAGGILWRNFPEATLPPVEIKYDKDGPLALFGVNDRGHRRMELSSQDPYWSQHVYQFSHEFFHLLVDCKEGDRSNHWFEESVCEMASIYVIEEMAKEWRIKPAISGAEDYAKSFASYAKNLERKESYQLPKGMDFKEWFAKKEATLREGNGYRRDLNGIIALQLLPYLREAPENWGAFGFINEKRTKKKVSFQTYLANWHESSPKKYHPFIDQVVAEFGKKS